MTVLVRRCLIHIDFSSDLPPVTACCTFHYQHMSFFCGAPERVRHETLPRLFHAEGLSFPTATPRRLAVSLVSVRFRPGQGSCELLDLPLGATPTTQFRRFPHRHRPDRAFAVGVRKPRGMPARMRLRSIPPALANRKVNWVDRRHGTHSA